MAKIALEVVTPNGSVVSKTVDVVTAPGSEGDFSVLANHSPLLSIIRIGVLSYEIGDTRDHLVVGRGYCEVSNNRVTVLVDSAEYTNKIDVARATKAKERAEKRLAEAAAQNTSINIPRAEIALKRAIMRINAAKYR